MTLPTDPAASVAGAVDRYCDRNPTVCLQAAARLASAGKDVSIAAISRMAQARSANAASLQPDTSATAR
ncbi:MAG: hypothetical protein KDJ29_12950 [Hyphomicrobiales bacterium]|nr:hypothetical protein [Hyphomicrobiales bacterium]